MRLKNLCQPGTMIRLKSILSPKSYLGFIEKRIQERRLRNQPNLIGTVLHPPGHFYSPLLDIQELGPGDSGVPFDGADWWEHIDLRPVEQRAYYEDLLEKFLLLPFPSQKSRRLPMFPGLPGVD